MPLFAAGQKMTAAFMNLTCPVTTGNQMAMSTTSGTTTSASYVNSLSAGGVVSINYVAPASGSIWVTIFCTMSALATATMDTAFALTGAAGTLGASDPTKVTTVGTTAVTKTRRVKIDGLTPGAAGTITLWYRTSTSTMTVNSRQIAWEPAGA